MVLHCELKDEIGEKLSTEIICQSPDGADNSAVISFSEIIR